MTSLKQDPVVLFESAAAFEAWLEKSLASCAGLWLKIAKNASGIASVTYAEALDVALCFGWIDGQKQPFDETYWLQRFTPRKPRSKWSKINCGKVEALIAAGRMRPAGQQQVDDAKADGRWAAAYEGQSKATVPPDLQQALDASPKAKEFFATLTGANRYAILYRIHEAKKPETRARRIQKFLGMLERHETVHG